MQFDNMFSKAKPLLCFAMASLWMMAVVPARADYAILANGFRLQVERRENYGSVVRLFIAGGGYADLAASAVQSYEKEEAPPPPPLPRKSPEPADLYSTAGAHNGLDPVLLKSMAAEESNFNPRAVSPKGAGGLMQLMPRTAEWLGVKDFFSPVENVEGGALYVRTLLERYGGNLAKALAAYNAGPAKVDLYRGIPPYAETQNYVRRVIERFNREKTKQ